MLFPKRPITLPSNTFFSIKPKEISAEILSKIKVEIKPSLIVLKDNLNKIGEYKVDIKFHSEVSAQIKIKIDKIQAV